MGAIRWGHGGRVPPLVQSGDIICHVPTFSLQVSQCLGFTPTCPPTFYKKIAPMLTSAWILLRSGSVRFIILKTVLYELAFRWIKGINVWKKEYTAMLKFFFIEKLQKISTNQWPSETFVLVFYAQYLSFWEQSLI